MLWFLGAGAPAQGVPPAKPAFPESVRNPLARQVVPPDATDSPLPLPQEPRFPVAIDDYENPLLLFSDSKQDLPMTGEPDADLLPPITPSLPDRTPPSEPVIPLSAEETKLRTLGEKIAASLVSIRVWDEFGGQLAEGAGTFITRDGVVLTDTGMVHPEIAKKTDYITLTGADGTNQRVTGFYVADLVTGVTLLQAEIGTSTPLELSPGQDFGKPRDCHVLAVSEQRGLVLTTAKVQMDSALTGLGWLNLRGAESSGAVGSPVLSDDGGVVAMVGMKVPLKNWMNFALPIDQTALVARRQRPNLQPLARLPKSPTLKQVVEDPEFLNAFQTLQQRRVESAMRKLLQLVSRYPRSAECWALLGLSASHMGAAPEALNCQRKAVALDPQAGLYWHQLAFAKLRESPGALPDTTEDLEALELAVQQRPNDGLAWLMLASRHVRGDDLGKAHDALRRVTLLAPNVAQGHYLMAYVRGRQHDLDGAQQAIRQSLLVDPASAEAWYYQGLLLEKSGRFDEAAKAFRNTVRLHPAHPQAWLNLAHAYRKSNRPNEAREAFIQHQKRSEKH